MAEEDTFDHPIRKGAMLRRVIKPEPAPVLLEVRKRFRDIDNEHYEYKLVCPTHTGYHRYRAEDIGEIFEDTGLTNENQKPVQVDEIRELYQSLHDKHGEHLFRTVHDPETMEPTAEQCIACRKRRELTQEQ